MDDMIDPRLTSRPRMDLVDDMIDPRLTSRPRMSESSEVWQ